MLSTLIAIGPLVLGMDLDEIRAATPGVAWTEQLVSPHSGRVFGLQAPAALQVAGLPLDVVAQVHYYHQHLQFTGRFPAKDAASCEQAALAWLTAIEPQAGPFTSAEPRTTPGTPGNLQWHSSRGPNGIVLMPSMGAGTASRVSGELLPFGMGSRALVATFDDQFRTRPRKALFAGAPAGFTLEAFRRLPAQNVEVLVEYHAAPLECALRVAMVRRTEPPPPTEFDTAKARVAFAPSVAVRHWLLPDAVAAATAAVQVPLRCDIDRVLGAPTSCTRTTSDPLPPVFEVHAQRLAREVFYDMAGQDRDDPQPMTGLVQVRLDPADRRPHRFPGGPPNPAGAGGVHRPAERRRKCPALGPPELGQRRSHRPAPWHRGGSDADLPDSGGRLVALRRGAVGAAPRRRRLPHPVGTRGAALGGVPVSSGGETERWQRLAPGALSR